MAWPGSAAIGAAAGTACLPGVPGPTPVPTAQRLPYCRQDREPQLLLDGVRSARVAYFGHGQWSDGWDGGVGRLPDAVALELELERYGHVRQVFVLPGGGA